jgi:hypothetical protein
LRQYCIAVVPRRTSVPKSIFACRAHLANIHSLSRSIPAHNIVSAMLQAPVLSLHGRLHSMHMLRER